MGLGATLRLRAPLTHTPSLHPSAITVPYRIDKFAGQVNYCAPTSCGSPRINTVRVAILPRPKSGSGCLRCTGWTCLTNERFPGMYYSDCGAWFEADGWHWATCMNLDGQSRFMTDNL